MLNKRPGNFFNLILCDYLFILLLALLLFAFDMLFEIKEEKKYFKKNLNKTMHHRIIEYC